MEHPRYKAILVGWEVYELVRRLAYENRVSMKRVVEDALEMAYPLEWRKQKEMQEKGE